jgi:hypothetical protein
VAGHAIVELVAQLLAEVVLEIKAGTGFEQLGQGLEEGDRARLLAVLDGQHLHVDAAHGLECLLCGTDQRAVWAHLLSIQRVGINTLPLL